MILNFEITHIVTCSELKLNQKLSS